MALDLVPGGTSRMFAVKQPSRAAEVHLLVGLQVAPSSKRLGAYFAGVRPLPGMQPGVQCQVAGLRKSLPALLTRERPRAVMDSHMYDEMAGAPQCHTTYAARDWSPVVALHPPFPGNKAVINLRRREQAHSLCWRPNVARVSGTVTDGWWKHSFLGGASCNRINYIIASAGDSGWVSDFSGLFIRWFTAAAR